MNRRDLTATGAAKEMARADAVSNVHLVSTGPAGSKLRTAPILSGSTPSPQNYT